MADRGRRQGQCDRLGRTFDGCAERGPRRDAGTHFSLGCESLRHGREVGSGRGSRVRKTRAERQRWICGSAGTHAGLAAAALGRSRVGSGRGRRAGHGLCVAEARTSECRARCARAAIDGGILRTEFDARETTAHDLATHRATPLARHAPPDLLRVARRIRHARRPDQHAALSSESARQFARGAQHRDQCDGRRTAGDSVHSL